MFITSPPCWSKDFIFLPNSTRNLLFGKIRYIFKGENIEYLTLDALEGACRSCVDCNLSTGRTNVVVGRGNGKAKLLIIGEGPGRNEDETGLPFVGRAGKLLDKILDSVGIDSNQDAYISNIVKCRPPENRKPSLEEIRACEHWLKEQIRLINPEIILLVGATAVQGILGVKEGITKIRGSWIEENGMLYMPIFHPSYLLRNPSKDPGKPKWLTWQDMKKVKGKIDSL
ncbi:MAG: uracil-DNA glycosylase [Candidatus Actinomarinales bacterium]|nr:MAG: uracil-DNA glycosylase [Candidatus Actinomarinales bacterium]